MDSLEELISILKKFPGLGSKSAKRIAFFLLKQDKDYLKNLGDLISGMKNNLRVCSQCGNISSNDPCSICSDPLRDRKTLCIVEDLEALSAFEDAGIYNGLYHVLGKKVSPIRGEDLSDESIKFLLTHIKTLKPEEIIIATSPKIEGDMTYYTLTDILQNVKVKKITRIAFGLPIGSSIEFADKVTLHTALESRRQVK
ncbi:MAG: recombination protein RecR [Synergistaceae bacterium]|nr:recombination protein RecR [Synergistaceae bacterium]MBQ6737920.1 recombination protein RecR [Synergistaceae bacterium]MBR0078953.1 recombination protein RecR [Synergistaceae bacterium]MBR0233523.1 recombination protein RecR [Synergistaceae bacterium]